MKLKNISIVMTGILAIAIIAFYFVSANSQTNSGKINIAGDTSKIYTCPMHPDVISDKPGKCPKCGMDLVLKTQDNTDSSKTDMKKDMNMNMNMDGCKEKCKSMGCKMENCKGESGGCKDCCADMKDMQHKDMQQNEMKDCKSGCKH